MIWFQGQPRHVSYLQKNPHLMSFLYHYMSMFLISPPFFFLACFSLYFLIFFISYLLRPVLVPWPRLLSVCVHLLSVPWATNWDTKNKKAGITILHDPRHCMVPRFWKRLYITSTTILSSMSQQARNLMAPKEDKNKPNPQHALIPISIYILLCTIW